MKRSIHSQQDTVPWSNDNAAYDDGKLNRNNSSAYEPVTTSKNRFNNFLKKYLVQIVAALLCTFIAWAAGTLISINKNLAVIQTRIDYLEKQVDIDGDCNESLNSFALELSKIEAQLTLLEQQLKYSE